MSKTIEELVKKVEFLHENLNAQKSRLNGLNIDFGAMDTAISQCKELEKLGEQSEALRAQLSEITRQSNMLMASIKETFQENKKIIKTNFEQENWMKFGVQDKR